MMLFVVMCVSLLCPFTAQAATGMDSKSVCGEAKGTLTNLVTGETIDVPLTLVEETSQRSGDKTQTYEAQITIPNDMNTRGSIDKEDEDGSVSYHARLKIYYNDYYTPPTGTTTGLNHYLLTKYEGEWTRLDSAVSISNRWTRGVCQIGTTDKSEYHRNEGMSFTHSTDFTEHIPEIANAFVGADMVATLSRNAGSSWEFKFSNFIVNQTF